MPRLKSGKLSNYCHHRASGQAVVTLGGKDHYLGPWNSAASKAEYDRVVREWLATVGVADKRGELTVMELLAAFKQHAKECYVNAAGRNTQEYRNYLTLVKRLSKLYGRTLAHEFGPLRLKALRDSLIDEKLSRTSVN